jgi:hypothetical protein
MICAIQRRPQFGWRECRRERGGHYTYHFVWFAIDQYGGTEDRRIAAEATLPQRVAEHCNSRIRLILGFRERPAGEWWPPEHCKQPGRYGAGDHRLRLYVAADGALAHPQALDGFDQRQVLAEPQEHTHAQRISGRPLVLPRRHQEQLHEPVAVGERQRTNERGVDHGKYRRRGTDDDREGRDRHDRVSGTNEKAANRMS